MEETTETPKKRISDNERYNYYRHTLLLDLDDPEDQQIQQWLLSKKNRKNSYSKVIKRAVVAAMVAQ